MWKNTAEQGALSDKHESISERKTESAVAFFFLFMKIGGDG
jgi:hypothetical protein